MSQTAKIFRSGNSQAVRLPKAFRFEEHDDEITREGDADVLRPTSGADYAWPHLRKAKEIGLSDDFMENGREQPPMPPDDPNKMFD